MAENRPTVNRIRASLSNLDVKLGNIMQALEHDLLQVRKFVQLYLQLDAIIQIVRHTVWTIHGTYSTMNKYIIFRPSITISYHTQKFKSITHRN